LTVTLGLEKLLQAGPGALGGRKIGLVTNHTGVDRMLRQNIDLLRAEGFDLVALYGPEHGVRGGAQAGAVVGDAVDPWSGLPAYSLYGKTKKPTPAMLEGVEVLLFDIWDIGARFYTYPYTMAYCMEAAKEKGIPIYVLDRPNPVGGLKMEGPLLEKGLETFVGLYPIPTRHGMTLGELARLFNAEFGIGADLTVIPCEGWSRSMYWEETGHPFVPASPNSTGMDMAVLYTGTCHFEGTNWSEARGTTKPFEMIGAPWAEGNRLADALNAYDLRGVRFRPTFFTPTFSKHAGVECQGVQVHVTDRHACKPVLTGLTMLEAVFRLYPEQSSFRHAESPGAIASIDRLAGSVSVRESIEAERPIRPLYDSWAPSMEGFAKLREPYLLYQ
jgi:uncharacterized protein YbbC (DUF1343 family)